MEEDKFQQTLLMKQILEEIAFLKAKMPNGELALMQSNIEILKNSQSSMKEDLSDLKKKLLDPENGVIVKVNENTKFRLSEERRSDEYVQYSSDLDSLKKWQSGVNKALWLIFGSIIAIGIKILFKA
jgi:hypothetical protein